MIDPATMNMFRRQNIEQVTRGAGWLEYRLSVIRMKIANRLIPTSYRQGRILDIGCGVYPLFLLQTDFKEKYALNNTKVSLPGGLTGQIHVSNFDVEKDNGLPFDDDYFDVITMLAVCEHIEPVNLFPLLREIRRTLKSSGVYILTTPAPWTDPLLRVMAKWNLVSSEEIEDHKTQYPPDKIKKLLNKAGFDDNKMTHGYFEIYMNLWVKAFK